MSFDECLFWEECQAQSNNGNSDTKEGKCDPIASD